MRTIYNILMIVAAGIVWPVVLPMVLLSEKRRKTVPYRLGIVPRPMGGRDPQHGKPRRPIWVHALSVGEVLSALPLLQILQKRYKDRRVLLSVSTLTGFELAKTRLSGTRWEVFFSPYDIPLVVSRMIDSVDPALMVIVETDIWPNMVYHLHHRRIPIVLANARLSPRTFSGYRKLRSIMGPTLRRISKICAQSGSEADRFYQLGVGRSRLVVTGNVKFDQVQTPVTEEQVSELAKRLGIGKKTPLLIAGSTHNGEEAILADAFQAIRRDYPTLRLIVVPRNPKRAASVDRMFTAAGFSCGRLSDSEQPQGIASPDVWVVDVIGVLRGLYRLSNISFIGGSLVKRGGHNPLEAAECGKPILFGPHMTDFPDISRKLKEGKGAIEVRTATDIHNELTYLMGAPEEAATMGQRAFAIYRANQGAVDRTLDVIGSVLIS